MTRQPPKAKNPVKAARNTLRIVEALTELDGAGITELSRELDLNKSSVHNYLSTLEEEEYVWKDGTEYHVGLRFFEVGAHARHRRLLYKVGQPEARKLAQQTGERANILTEEHGRGFYLCKEKGDQAVQVDAHVGSRVHLHNTALGKVILAYMPRERVEMIVDRHGLPQTTTNTIGNREELFDELETIREREVAYDREERLNGIQCVAAPILRNDDVIAGAISISGPTTRLEGDRLETEIRDRLEAAANIIELNISYS
ncbi:IclR family transcriptional regulator [Halobacteria archaeon AArc-m2/3/4]|uniref:IclR family transcriptional regulator n=1 Tax=Natronoglomus mannanivorans TaxID=2979990 RepID=A0AAP2Z0H8_9EURY|nr:IclR family transcriptional regulator [Halobacteria archaeon AArc-xg1-1]MCU4975323.1 IclR family transcriptional regulator [Halobacteria archaeon AArc-m2/3/4]